MFLNLKSAYQLGLLYADSILSKGLKTSFLSKKRVLVITLNCIVAQSTRAVEYTNCTSVEG